MKNRFSLILFFYYSQFCILFSFAAVFFKEQGYSDGKIGQLAAFSGLAVLAANPVAGRIADRVGEKTVTIICLIVSVAMTAGLYLGRKYFVGVFLFYGLISVFNKVVSPLLDNWLSHYSKEHTEINYGNSRAVGCLGSALCAVSTGFVIDSMGFGAVFVLCMIFNLAAVLLALRTPEGSVRSTGNGNTNAGIKVLLRNKRYLVLIITSAVLFLGVTTEVTYYPVLFLKCGGNNRMLGISLFLMSCSEMIGMSSYFKLRKKIQTKNLLLISLICYTIKLTLQIFINATTGLILLQLMQAVTYGIFLPAVVEMVSDLVPIELSATGMALCASCFNGVGVVLGNWIASAICESYGLRAAYLSAGIFCLLAVFIFLFGQKQRVKFRRS